MYNKLSKADELEVDCLPFLISWHSPTHTFCSSHTSFLVFLHKCHVIFCQGFCTGFSFLRMLLPPIQQGSFSHIIYTFFIISLFSSIVLVTSDCIQYLIYFFIFCFLYFFIISSCSYLIRIRTLYILYIVCPAPKVIYNIF